MKKRLGDYIHEYSVRNKLDEDIPVYSVTNSQGFCRDYFSKDVASKDRTTYKIVPKGCFAYNPSRINVGSVDWQRNEERVIVSPLYNVFSVSSELDQQYLYYYLKSTATLYRIKNVATGSVRDNLRLSMLYDFMIELPEFAEQREIVKKLDLLSNLIQLRDSQLSALDELVKARFVELFGDTEHNNRKFPVSKLADLCCVSSSKRIYQDEQSTSGIPFLRISDLSTRIDNGIETCELYIPVEKYQDLCAKKLVPVAGDILITSRGTLGKCYIVKESDEFYFQDGMISWLSNIDKRVSSLYISYLFSTSGIQKQIANLQAGSTVTYLSISMLKKLDIMIPPRSLQNEFAAFVEQVDKSRLLCATASDFMAEYSGFMSNCFV